MHCIKGEAQKSPHFRVGAFKKARVEKIPLNIRIQWNARAACVSECVLKTLAGRGLRVGPSKFNSAQTRCIVEKARLRKVHVFGDFLGVFDFQRSACSLRIPQENL